ncbi:MAG: hypothetical protein IT195_12555 [Microthrixaceae bacterium]|nr:hypothetical protein [Microthrixaceae bacterium]
MREVRVQVLGVSQREIAEVLGFTSQSKVSLREKHPDEQHGDKPVEPRPVELVAIEDHYGLQRGTILRRAGYVVDVGDDPLEQVEAWSWMSRELRDAIKLQVQLALRNAKAEEVRGRPPRRESGQRLR